MSLSTYEQWADPAMKYARNECEWDGLQFCEHFPTSHCLRGRQLARFLWDAYGRSLPVDLTTYIPRQPLWILSDLSKGRGGETQ